MNSPRRVLRILTAEERGEQHCQIRNMSLGTDYMVDSAADVLGGNPSGIEGEKK
ncbi:hypothetical protein [Rhodococcus sp. R1101]|uniref:hypothetical protein n=1 Tax=Rhodococcus sp. R1101 TaxID=1170698 RepID=UPI0002E3A126|nr:hypothetical protein [Rhodococcus sp. R1101]